MEASDTFGAGVEAPTDDPFAETSMSEFDQTGTDPLADPAEEPTPLVDREGKVIEERSEAAAPVESAEEEAMRISAEEELAAQEAAAQDPLADAPTAGEQAAPSAGEKLDEVPPTEPLAMSGATSIAEDAGMTGDGESDPQPADDPASSATQTSDQTIPSSPAERDAAAPAESPGDAGPTDASAIQEPVTDGEKFAPVPEELKDKSGAITHRRYIILTPEGSQGKHKEVSWYENKAGEMVKKGTPGAKKQSVALARGQEDALAIGYRAMGEPDGGVPLRAVAYTYWGELVHVEPKYDAPVRQRLTFRR